MDPPISDAIITSAPSSDDTAGVVCPLEGPLAVPAPVDSPPPPVARSTAEHPEAISLEWKLRTMVEMERRSWMLPGVDPVDFWCNIPGVNFASDLFDRSGDSEWARSVLAYLRTKHLQSLGIEPEEWMVLKVMCRRGDGSWG
jgi:hypothetical protein